MEDANSSRTVDGDKTPGWASGLKLRGVYYEGYGQSTTATFFY